MAEYLTVDAARALPGLRLVLTVGAPGPWGESAKGIFHVKGIPFARVRQDPGQRNEPLVAWTGRDNAPQAIWQDEPARGGWDEIALLADRLAPAPPLVPADPDARVQMFGLSHEICGEWGFGWVRRLMMLHAVLEVPGLPDAVREPIERLARKYGYRREAAEAAPARAAEILRMLAARLEAQRARGSRFLLGESLTAADVHWAAFAAMVSPLPPELCPMHEGIRGQYEASHPLLREAAAPILLEHRDFVYREYLELPIDL